MRLDDRARRAADYLRREMVDPAALGSSTDDPFERFERSLARRTRNQRVAAVVVSSVLAAVAIVFVARAIGTAPQVRPAGPPSGQILYGEWDERLPRAHWFTVGADGSNLRDLHVVATCAEWFPDGSRIFITNDAAVDEAGAPLRPAVIEPDGSDLTPLDATRDPDLELGCGDVSPDGNRIVLEGFNPEDPTYDGIYSVRASDGGGLVRLTNGPDIYPQFSPDGSRVVFLRTKAGVNPDGAGALFVVDADGANARRITPWGFAFLDQAWSPDGRWIVFQKPYGRLFVVHPDGSGLHEVPVELPKGSGAREPSWSPEGGWIVFALDRGGSSNVYAVRPDGTGLTRITETQMTQDSLPDWRPETR